MRFAAGDRVERRLRPSLFDRLRECSDNLGHVARVGGSDLILPDRERIFHHFRKTVSEEVLALGEIEVVDPSPEEGLTSRVLEELRA